MGDPKKKMKNGDSSESGTFVAIVLLAAFWLWHSSKILIDFFLVWFADEEHINVPIKYPIDDLLVQPSADDHALLKRPPLATDFRVPKYSVGDLLMVWDFCLSFGRVLNLSPFSLVDLENAICHKESNALLVEIHTAIFHLLIKDEGDYFTILRTKKRKLKVFSCPFLDLPLSPLMKPFLNPFFISLSGDFSNMGWISLWFLGNDKNWRTHQKHCNSKKGLL